MYDALIDKIQVEIGKIAEKEAKTVTTLGQKQLQLLLENKEKLKRYSEKHSESKTYKTGIQNSIDELEEYYEDYCKHKVLYLQEQSVDEKTHMNLELKKFAACFKDIFESMWAMASTAEEKKVLAQLSGGFAAIAEQK